MNDLFVKKQSYEMEERQENIEMIIYSAFCFFVPFFLGGPQIAVGIMVNMALVMAALNVRGEKLLPVIIMPSIGVLLRGILFGPFTMFLIYMIPFIWMGNALLVLVFKKLCSKVKVKRAISLVIGAVAKSLFLFGAAFAFFSAGVLPKLFLTTMGAMQLYTALIGGFAALSLQKIRKLFKEKRIV